MSNPSIQSATRNQPRSWIHLADVPTIAWKNGGGFTCELLAWPHPENWVVRISVAVIDKSGPFSIFSGVRRWFGVLTGAGVRLSSGGYTSVIAQDTPLFQFDGGLPHHCDLVAGSTSDFNLMVKASDAQCHVQRITGVCVVEPRSRSLVAVYANSDQTTVEFADGGSEPLRLMQGDLYWRIVNRGDARWRVSSQNAICLEVTID